MSVDSIGKYLELSYVGDAKGTKGMQGIQVLEPGTRDARECKVQKGTHRYKGPEGDAMWCRVMSGTRWDKSRQFKFLKVLLSFDCHKWMKHKKVLLATVDL